MPLPIPSLPDLSAGIWAAIRARLPGADGAVYPNNIRIIGKVLAMAVHEADLRAVWLFRQIFTSTADGAYLDLHAYEVGLARKPAAAASGTVTFAATPGAVFSSGLRFVRGDGAFFVTTSAAATTTDTVTFAVVAEEAGVSGTTAPGAPFSPASPVADIGETGTADLGGLGGGADREGDEPLRARILFRKRARPRGGNAADYAEWATEVPGIARAFAKGWTPGAGAVSVWPLREGSGVTALPLLADLTPVAAYLEARRPAAATVFVNQAVAQPIDITIAGLSPDTLALRGEITASIDDTFDERAAVALPGEGASFSVSWIREAVSAAIGENRHVLLYPDRDVPLVSGTFPVRGTLTFV